jgi:hypothetical protein
MYSQREVLGLDCIPAVGYVVGGTLLTAFGIVLKDGLRRLTLMNLDTGTIYVGTGTLATTGFRLVQNVPVHIRVSKHTAGTLKVMTAEGGSSALNVQQEGCDAT